MKRLCLGFLLAVLFVGFGTTEAVAQSKFVRGDANADGTIDIADCIFLLNCLFLGGLCPPCDDAADANDDGLVNIADALYKLVWLFLGGPVPPPPTPSSIPYPPTDCGLDPTADGLGCVSFPPCVC